MAESRDIHQAVAYLEAGHDDLGRRLGGLEKGFHVLQGEVHTGFSNIQSGFSDIKSKIESLNSRPTFNPHEMIRSVLSLAILFGMIVTGIIWITTGQFGGIVAEQRAYNAAVTDKLKEHSEVLRALGNRIQWTARVDPDPRR
jgi:hypothetical protein